jgi:DNA-binding transcriptional ArsR family regulator
MTAIPVRGEEDGLSRHYRHPAMADVQLYDVLAAIADPVRLELVRELAHGAEHTAGTLAEQVGVSPSTLTHHLRIMRDAGMVRTRAEGVHRWTSLRMDELEERFPGFVWWISAALNENAPDDQRRG